MNEARAFLRVPGWPPPRTRTLLALLVLGALVPFIPSTSHARPPKVVEPRLGPRKLVETTAPRVDVIDQPGSCLAIDWEHGAHGTALTLTLSQPPLSYTAYEPGPGTIIVDLLGMDAPWLPVAMPVGTPELQSLCIESSQGKESSWTRIELSRTPGPRASLLADPNDPRRLLLRVEAPEPAKDARRLARKAQLPDSDRNDRLKVRPSLAFPKRDSPGRSRLEQAVEQRHLPDSEPGPSSPDRGPPRLGSSSEAPASRAVPLGSSPRSSPPGNGLEERDPAVLKNHRASPGSTDLPPLLVLPESPQRRWSPAARSRGAGIDTGNASEPLRPELISLAMRDADIEDVLRSLAKAQGLNLVIDPVVSGLTISLDLKAVPWDQCLDVVLKSHELTSILEGTVLRVSTVDKIMAERKTERAMARMRSLTAPTRSIARRLSYSRAGDVHDMVREIVSDRGLVLADERTNMIIVRDLAENMREVEALLDLVDIPTRQIRIDARIVEVTRSFSSAAGITWGLGYIANREFGNDTGWSLPNDAEIDYAVNLPPLLSTSGLGLAFRNVADTFRLDVDLASAEQRGHARTVSRPSLVVMDNAQASIESGIQIPVVTTTDLEVDVSFVSATLKLAVRPQITADDKVLLDVVVASNEPVFLTSNADTPAIATRESHTVLSVEDKRTTVIGGISLINEGTASGRVPGLSRLPLVSGLFRNRRVNRTEDQLMIFLTVNILG